MARGNLNGFGHALELARDIRNVMDDGKLFKLTAADGGIYESEIRGELGGHKPHKRYGQLNCPAAIRALPNYAKSRVFFADEATAIAAGYRPCHSCMPARYEVWKLGGVAGTDNYPWLKLPPASK